MSLHIAEKPINSLLFFFMYSQINLHMLLSYLILLLLLFESVITF